ncbi:hypothetical protein SCLO_1001920 [Sphingobium cloacae]|uniref:Polyketide cyclase/dehydrase n=2 Tax=Sphingobium cloacae TaxID=120107 RepID=A0A1E1EYE6_9SPHN|nr:hypothetical protein SCLO_1001920 [Sphingobium cloacae]
MAQIEESAELNRNADDAWRAFGAWEAVADWHPMLERVEADGNQPGARRRAYTKDGQEQVERLVSRDEASRSYRYAMVETGLPVENYMAEFRIDAVDADHSKVTWTARFDEIGRKGEGAEAVRGFFEAGVKALASSCPSSGI